MTLHECRRTQRVVLMAAPYILKENHGVHGRHAELQMVQRYTKLLLQPDEANPAERLNAYVRSRRDSA